MPSSIRDVLLAFVNVISKAVDDKGYMNLDDKNEKLRYSIKQQYA